MNRSDAFADGLSNALRGVGGEPVCARALGTPPIQGRIRRRCADFQVFEILGFEPDGEGNHQLFQLEKTGITTPELVAIMARAAGLPRRDIGYCGLKDKYAVTRQWISVPVAGRADWDWTPDAAAPVKVLARARHRRKLRPGSHRANAFQIRICEIAGCRDELDACLGKIAREGVPNYFGAQRFGRGGQNLARADAMLRGELRPRDRHLRGVYLSALRARLFNAVVSARVARGSWHRLLRGDCAMLDGTRSVFRIDDVDSQLAARAAAGDIHPTGPLFGAGDSMVRATARAVESAALAEHADRCAGLARLGVRAARRSLRMRVRDLGWDWEPDDALWVSFVLDRGQFATSVVRECCTCTELPR